MTLKYFTPVRDWKYFKTFNELDKLKKTRASFWPIRMCLGASIPTQNNLKPSGSRKFNVQKWFIGCLVFPAIFFFFLLAVTLMTHSIFISTNLQSPFPCPLPRTHEHLQRPPLQLLSPGAEPVGLGHQTQSFFCGAVALSLAAMSLTPVFLSCWFLSLSIPSAFSISTCTIRAKQVSRLSFLECRIGTMTAPNLWRYCVGWWR